MSLLDKEWLSSVAGDESIIPFTVVDRRKLRLLAEIALRDFDQIEEEEVITPASTSDFNDDSAAW